MLFGFQNCGENVSFDNSAIKASQPDGSVGGQGEAVTGPGSGSDGDGLENGNNPIVDGGNSPTVPAPILITDSVINDQRVDFDQCQSYQELPAGTDRIQLPAKSANGICYYLKIFNSVALHPSGTQGEQRDGDVLSSNHNGNFDEYISPFIMGDRSVSLNNSNNWAMSLSGDFDDPSTKMAIDNYFLVQFKYGITQPIELVSAFGTADAEPGRGQLPILYKDVEVAFQSFAPSGTALVEAISLKAPAMGAADFQGEIDLRIRALDCGGSAQLRDVYMVFH